MARLWSSGFELQSATTGVEWDLTVGAPTIDTTIKRSGAASLRCNPTGTSLYVHQTFSAVNTTDDLYYRFYLRIAAAPDGIAKIFRIRNVTPSDLVGIKLNTDRTLELWNLEDNAQVGSDSSALELDTWYRIELKVDTTTIATTAIEAKIDGTAFASGTINLATGQAKIECGTIDDISADLYFDDIAINDGTGSYQTGYPGAGSIVHIYPNAAGDINECSSGDYTSVDEKPTPDDATSYLIFDADNDDFLANCEASSVPGIGSSDTITLVQVGVRQRAASGTSCAFTLKIESQASGTLLSGTNFTQDDANWKTNGDVVPKIYRLTSYVDPQAGGAWTPALLDTMQIGGTCTDATPDFYITSFWALVEYVVATPVDKIQGALARITKTVDQTQAALSRITVVTDKTQTAVATISGETTVDKIQGALARITKTVDTTQTALARVTATTDKTQTALAVILKTVDREQIAKARITVTTDKTQTALAAILKTVDKEQTALAKIIQQVDVTQTSLARITVTVDKIQTALGRITIITDKTQVAKANISNDITTTKIQTAKALMMSTNPGPQIKKALNLSDLIEL